MSDRASNFSITINSVHVPEGLRFIPLPFEIVSYEGETKRFILTISAESDSKTEPVKGPGSYVVRTELPSGQWLDKTAVVPEARDQQGSVSGEVTIDFSRVEAAPVAGVRERIGSVRDPDEQQRLVNDTYNKYLPSRQRAPKKRSPVPLGGEAIRDDKSKDDFDDSKDIFGEAKGDAVTIDYGFFDRWESEASSGNLITSSDTLVIGRVGKSSAALPGSINLERHPGLSRDSAKWKPLLMRARFLSPTSGIEREEALIVCPPSESAAPLTLLPDADPGDNSNAPPLMALSQGNDPAVDALFSYVRGGALQSARQATPVLIERANDSLYSKVRNPVNAAVAAYTLLKLGNAEHKDWVANLANWFESLSDGAIIYGWYLIRAGEAEKAGEYFRKALERGVPMYSEGVRLMRDGLDFLRGLYGEDTQVRADALRAARIAACANLDSELTCLRLGKGLEVQFD